MVNAYILRTRWPFATGQATNLVQFIIDHTVSNDLWIFTKRQCVLGPLAFHQILWEQGPWDGAYSFSS